MCPRGDILYLCGVSMDLKPATTFDQQLQILQSRNCFVSDPVFCKDVLKRINYYRFTAYFLPFRQKDGNYISGTSFHRVYRIYEFDRKMRQVLFSVIEQIEIYLRTQLSYYHGHKYGPLGYMDATNYSNKHDHPKFENLINAEINHSRKILFVKHHLQNYGGQFPIWVITELFPFGMLSYFYADMKRPDKKAIASSLYGTTPKNLDSWLRCCTDLRNICAHYGRLYYRVFSAIPATPKDMNTRLGRTLFDNIMVLKFLYPDRDRWNNEFLPSIKALIEEYAGDIDLAHIGFSDNWEGILHRT